MLTFLRKAFEFVARPSHSRTLGLVLMFVLVAAVSLTVYVAQQQQETRQRASNENLFANPIIISSSDLLAGKTCTDSGGIQNGATCCPFTFPFYCSANQKCGASKEVCSNLSLSPTSTQIAIANTPTPTAKKTAGEKCFYPNADECATGLICDYYEEVGYGTCVSPIPTPTNTPIPTPTPEPGSEEKKAQCEQQQSFSCGGLPAGGGCYYADKTCEQVINFDMCWHGRTRSQAEAYTKIFFPCKTTPTPSQVAIANTPIPTPVSTSSTCINITEANSLARLYFQEHSTVTLQDVNIKARQYLQNPC